MLRWRKEKPGESGKIWLELSGINEKVYSALQELSNISSVSYKTNGFCSFSNSSLNKSHIRVRLVLG